MSDFADLCWSDARNRLALSPRWGGRVLSWVHDGVERVTPPFKLEGGLLRVLFGEERYPGASYLTPHIVLAREETSDGFHLHLRHYWNTPNQCMRSFGWPDKTGRLHLDGLLLDKRITFEASAACLLVEMTIRNLTDEVKHLTPWLHNSFRPWATQLFMVRDGQREPYRDEDIYWGCHVTGAARTLRCVLGDAAGSAFAVLGAATELLAGYYGQTAAAETPADRFAQTGCELRYDEVSLHPGEQWRSHAFLALTNDWRQWATDAPLELATRVEPADASAWDVEQLTPLLETWALPDERRQGLLVFSYLDKPPFSSPERFAAAQAFAGFRRTQQGAQAHVMLYAREELPGLHCAIHGGDGWQIAVDGGDPADCHTLDLARHGTAKLSLHGPSDLAGREAVSVRVTLDRTLLAELAVPPYAAVEPDTSCAITQMPQYLEARWRFAHGGFAGTTAEEFLEWQQAQRDRIMRYILAQITTPCLLEPRLLERQVGPTCVREKVVIQTEPGFHIPAYVVYAREAQGKLPAIIFYHGSGPGKQNFAPDEDPSCPRAEPDHELEYLPYQLARDLGCLVYVPDLRIMGELAETNPGQYGGRFTAAGVDMNALLAWDYLCQVDYLCSRPDVDATRIGAYGSSGGGNATAVIAALDERIGAAIVSSTGVYYLRRHTLPDGFFQHMRYQHPSRSPLVTDSPVAGADLLLLAAPRPLWILDGKEDIAASAVPNPAEDLRAGWYRAVNASRAAIAEGYRLLAAENRYRTTWEEGGHCAGMTRANISAWFARWLRLPGGQA